MVNVELDPTKLYPSEDALSSGHQAGLWPLRERLALSSIVADCNNQQIPWNNISRSLQRFTPPGADVSWCSAKNCAKQYYLLMESAEIYRKNKPDQVSNLSVPKILLKKLTIERMEELGYLLNANRSKNEFLKLLMEKVSNKKLSKEQLEQLKRYFLDKKAGNINSQNVKHIKMDPIVNYEQNQFRLDEYLRETYFCHKNIEKSTWSTLNHAPSTMKSNIVGEITSARQSTINASVLEVLNSSRRNAGESQVSRQSLVGDRSTKARNRKPPGNNNSRSVPPAQKRSTTAQKEEDLYEDEIDDSDSSADTESTVEMDCTQVNETTEESIQMNCTNQDLEQINLNDSSTSNESKLKLKINLTKKTVEMEEEGQDETGATYESSPEQERNRISLRNSSSATDLQSTPKIETNDQTIDSFQVSSLEAGIDYSKCMICQESDPALEKRTNHPYNFGKTQGYLNILQASKINPTSLTSQLHERLLLKIYTNMKAIETEHADKSCVDVLLRNKAFYHQHCYDIVRKFKLRAGKKNVQNNSAENSETSSVINRMGTPSFTNSSFDSGPSSPMPDPAFFDWQKIAKEIIDKTMRLCRTSAGRSFQLTKDLRQLQGLVNDRAFIDGVHFAHDFMAILASTKMSLIGPPNQLEDSSNEGSEHSESQSGCNSADLAKRAQQEELISKMYSLVEADINRLTSSAKTIS